jgi:hypothetical protein
MTSTTKVVGLPFSNPSARSRWLALRDVVGGALLLAAWLALWTVTWAAVAGPLRPADAVRAQPAVAARA